MSVRLLVKQFFTIALSAVLFASVTVGGVVSSAIGYTPLAQAAQNFSFQEHSSQLITQTSILLADVSVDAPDAEALLEDEAEAEKARLKAEKKAAKVAKKTAKAEAKRLKKIQEKEEEAAKDEIKAAEKAAKKAAKAEAKKLKEAEKAAAMTTTMEAEDSDDDSPTEQ